jgi:hypothetical protein
MLPERKLVTIVTSCLRRGRYAHDEGEDEDVNEEGEQEHTHCARDLIQNRPLLSRVEEHLIEAPKVHYTGTNQISHSTHMYGITHM